MKFNKIWGTTAKLFEQNNVEIHRIDIKKGGFCSKHYHNYKYNMFFVESGKLQVLVFRSDSSCTDQTILFAGENTIVKPGELHQFQADEDTIAYEIYWVQLENEDIVRSSSGGILSV